MNHHTDNTVARVPAAFSRVRVTPTPAERARLAEVLGGLLRSERLAAGWSLRRLAKAVGCATSTVRRLQAGQLRPRESLLWSLATVIAVDDPAPLAARLLEAAGPSLQPDTDGSVRRRNRRAVVAFLAGYRPLPTRIARPLRLHREADAAQSMALSLLAPDVALEDPTALGESVRLLAAARALREQAGPPFVVLLGNREIRAGWLS
jgi:transcriptional regulator with XRE-family HTH domain